MPHPNLQKEFLASTIIEYVVIEIIVRHLEFSARDVSSASGFSPEVRKEVETE